jgi:hypothetical protein
MHMLPPRSPALLQEHASTYQDDQQQLLQDAADEVEEILASAAPGLGITRSTSFSAVVVPPKDAKLVRRPSFHGEEEIIHVLENENWLKFYVNPYSGMAEAGLTEPVDLTQQSLGRLPQNVVKPFYARPTDQVRRAWTLATATASMVSDRLVLMKSLHSHLWTSTCATWEWVDSTAATSASTLMTC